MVKKQMHNSHDRWRIHYPLTPVSIPFTRVATAFFAVAFLLLAVASPEHPWLTPASYWLLFITSAVLFMMSSPKKFLLDVLVLLFIAFFLQRALIIHFFPDLLDYQKTIFITKETVEKAILFVFLCSLSIFVGHLLTGLIWKTSSIPPVFVPPMNTKEEVKFFSWVIPFERFFTLYAYTAIPFSLLGLFLLLIKQVGVAGVLFDSAFATIFRLSFLTNSLAVIAFLPLIVARFSKSTRILAVLILALQLLLGVSSTSKGTLISLFVAFLVCIYFAGKRIKAQYVVCIGALVLLIIFFYSPAIVAIRGGLLEGGSWKDALSRIKDAPFYLPEDLLFRFSERLGGFDWLVGLVTVGRESFPNYVGLPYEAVAFINSFVPGSLIDRSDWVSTAYLMPHIMRGLPLPTEASVSSHGENMGMLGMAYLYFGFWGGIAVLGIWSGLISSVLSSALGRIYKIVFFILFVVVMFAGGSIVTPVLRAYEALLVIFAVFLLHHFDLAVSQAHVKTGEIPDKARSPGPV